MTGKMIVVLGAYNIAYFVLTFLNVICSTQRSLLWISVPSGDLFSCTWTKPQPLGCLAQMPSPCRWACICPSPLSPHHCRCCRPISLPCFPMTWFPSSLAFPPSAPSSKSARFFTFVCMHSHPCARLSRMMHLHMYMHIHITLWHGRRQWVA